MKIFLKMKLVLLWILVLLIILFTIAGLFLVYRSIFNNQFSKAVREVQIANDSFSDYTIYVINQVDTLLKSVRGYYLNSESVEDTERFIASIGFDKSFVENIYLIDSEGLLVIPYKDRAKGISAKHRDYFLFHLSNPEDVINIGSVNRGQVTGKNQFRITRRINKADGSFGGVILIPVEPKAFTNYYSKLLPESENIATLVGTLDRKLRARSPAPSNDMWQKSIDSTLWDALKKRPTGSYRAVSFVDGIERQYIYKIVGDMPLVMLTGFSNKDVKSAVVKQIQPIVIVAIAFDIIIAMLALILTITYRQRDQMKKLSTIDALTGIFNRRYIQDFGCSEVARSKRYGRPVSLIMIDIDHFKMINDKWGHPTGDRVIQELTRAMLSVVRSQDVVGRLGGEEFLVILPETDQAGTKVIAERIHNFVQNDVMTIADNGSTIKFTVSVGTATLLDPQDSFDSLSSCADKALYEAKSRGRNCVVTT